MEESERKRLEEQQQKREQEERQRLAEQQRREEEEHKRAAAAVQLVAEAAAKARLAELQVRRDFVGGRRCGRTARPTPTLGRQCGCCSGMVGKRAWRWRVLGLSVLSL